MTDRYDLMTSVVDSRRYPLSSSGSKPHFVIVARRYPSGYCGGIADVVLASTKRKGKAGHAGPYTEGGSFSSAPPAPALAACSPPVLPSQRWPLVVLCRDTNYLHQFATLMLHHTDIDGFLCDELYGVEWSRSKLEKILDEIYRTGRGGFDPADIIIDTHLKHDFWDHDKLHGFVDAPPPPQKSFAQSIFPLPLEFSRKD